MHISALQKAEENPYFMQLASEIKSSGDDLANAEGKAANGDPSPAFDDPNGS